MEQVGLEVETIKISKDEMPEDKVESDATTDDSKQSPTEQGKLVFATGERGLPSLNRGYRTPDPSLSRLPKCGALELMVAAENGHADAEFPRAYDTPRERVETKPLNTEPQKEVRTPSPWLSRIRTPSPLLERAYDLPPPLPFSPHLPRGSRVRAKSPWSTSSSGNPGEDDPPSLGSIGHPYSCGAACKYSGKTRGCKEGRNCDHCHLCEWKRTRVDKAPTDGTGDLCTENCFIDAVIRPEVERGKQISFHKEQLIMTWDGVGHSTSLEMAATLNGWMMRYVALS
eukprot:s588_g25.t2